MTKPPRQYKQSGFTLIEIIVGMVMISVALLLIYSVLIPQTRQGIDPIWQVRATALAKSLSNEILAKSFDQNSNPSGSLLRCSEVDPCSTSSQLGPDAGETRQDYNDVDDFHGFTANDANIVSSAGYSGSINGNDLYQGFVANVSVFYDQNLDGINDDDINQDGSLDTGTLVASIKLVKVTITTPGGEDIVVSSIRGNF